MKAAGKIMRSSDLRPFSSLAETLPGVLWRLLAPGSPASGLPPCQDSCPQHPPLVVLRPNDLARAHLLLHCVQSRAIFLLGVNRNKAQAELLEPGSQRRRQRAGFACLTPRLHALTCGWNRACPLSCLQFLSCLFLLWPARNTWHKKDEEPGSNR